MKEDYTREELISLCERAIVPHDRWSNRDSSSAQRQIGDAWALLKSGCPFRIITRENKKRKDHGCVTDGDTIWVEHYFTDFGGFENEMADNASEMSYIPTEKRLKQAKGDDWY